MRQTSDATRVVSAVYDAVERGDHPALRALLADDLEWRQAAQAVPAAGRHMVGAAALMEQVIRPIEEEWDGFSEDVDELHGEGERVVATGTYLGTHRATGRTLRAEFCHLWTVRDGVVVTFRQFTDTAAFHQACAGAARW